MSQDTVNLVAQANFCVPLVENRVFWVPMNSLGKSRYSNEEILAISEEKSSVQIPELRLNMYEAIQLFQAKRFEEINDIIYFFVDDTKWQLHKNGRYAYETNNGCCASAAAWLNYVISNTYPNRGYLHYLRPDSSGHILNYIYHDEFYYIVDMTAQVYKNAHFVPRETGLLPDYLGAKLYSGICIKTKNLNDYINYHRRIQLYKGFEFSYLQKEPTAALPPCHSFSDQNGVYYKEIGKSNILRMSSLHYQSCSEIACKELAHFEERYM